MKTYRLKSIGWIATAVLVAVVLAACSGSDDGAAGDSGFGDPVRTTYRFTVTNLTHNQPLAPPAFVLHSEGYPAWETGVAASDGIERLAESGEVDIWLDEAAADPRVVMEAGGSTIIVPGGSASVEVETEFYAGLLVSSAAMLVNTNDAFAGLIAGPIGTLAIGESLPFLTNAYDAGTEANSETAATVPGPAGGGTGFSPERNDRNFISVHPGVISAEDGLVGSVLDESHRWQNPVAQITVTRVK